MTTCFPYNFLQLPILCYHFITLEAQLFYVNSLLTKYLYDTSFPSTESIISLSWSWYKHSCGRAAKFNPNLVSQPTITLSAPTGSAIVLAILAYSSCSVIDIPVAPWVATIPGYEAHALNSYSYTRSVPNIVCCSVMASSTASLVTS